MLKVTPLKLADILVLEYEKQDDNRGFGHAFLSLEDNTKVVMRIDNYFHPEYRNGVAWNDPELNVVFPVGNPILSKSDQEAPQLKDSDCNL